MSPLERYLALLQRPGFSDDPAQRAVIELLDALYHALARRSQDLDQSRFSRLLHRLIAPSPAPLKGLYLWGGVGRGKTMLMDIFFECLPEAQRMRIHFHRFMQRVHHELKDLTGTADPLEVVAERLQREGNVLCFDEFFVSDIGDAMILGELLQALFERGVTLVATSNVEPNRLYENGLQRSRFLPAIELIETHTQVFAVPGVIDHRLRVLERAEIYHAPLDDEAETSLTRSFMALAPDKPEYDVVLEIEGRDIVARGVADDVVWFEFAEICEGPRSQNDYIELSRIYHAVLLSNVPHFTTRREDAARRFISLVDEFYDHNVKLIISAESTPTELYGGERFRFEFQRTESRLVEMQSHEYLARTHRA
ncbi:MAG: cell division protein ZapE [Gammaproteobacteria bacterium]|nr:cell division protein ZapE [Gammaproteobacteria bacterium]